ncbi:hypothetical protein ACJX0J_040660, partial [Zea mays]
MIVGYAQNGRAKDALHLFERMLHKNIGSKMNVNEIHSTLRIIQMEILLDIIFARLNRVAQLCGLGEVAHSEWSAVVRAVVMHNVVTSTAEQGVGACLCC